MKIFMALMLFSCLSGFCADVTPADADQSEQVEKRSTKSRITYKGGDGTSFEKAVIIVGAKNSMEGVPAESVWLKKKYKGYEKLQQALVQHEGKVYDVITIKTKRDKELVIYFDISGFLKGN